MNILSRAVGLILVLAFSAVSQASQNNAIPAVAQTPYPANHAGPRNNDYVDWEAPTNIEKSWEALTDSTFTFPCASGPEGHIYCASSWSLADDKCNLHALDSKTGKKLWEDRVDGKCLLDEFSQLNTPTVDRDGNVYMGDSQHMLSFTADGKLRWKNDINSVLPSRKGLPNPPFGLTLLPNGQLVTATMGDGWILIFDRDTGDLAAMPFNLPAEKRPSWNTGIGESNATLDAFNISQRPDGLLEQYMSEEGADLFWTFGLGESHYEADNAIAIDPKTGLMFVASGAAYPNEDNSGSLWALRYSEGKDGELGVIHVAFTVDLDVEGGIATTPAISQDGQFVLIADGDANMIVVDIPACDSIDDGSACPHYTAVPVHLDIVNSIAITPENRVILPKGKRHIQAIDLDRDKAGKVVARPVWLTQVNPEDFGSSLVTVFKNVAYVPVYLTTEQRSEIVAIRVSDGKIMARYDTLDVANITMAADGETLITQMILVMEVVNGGPTSSGVWGWRPLPE